MKRNQRNIIILFIIATAFMLWNRNVATEYTSYQGFIFGTTYSVIYEAPLGTDVQDELHQHLLDVVNTSLSTFNKKSIISHVNQNTAHTTDSAFEEVYYKAQELSELTEGAFDMTVAPLVNAWGFGYKNQDEVIPTNTEIDSLKAFVGYEMIKLVDHKIIKEHPQTTLDASAIAKGYSVDVACRFLEKKGITNYMVEIGGEIRVAGLNKKGNKWRLGIDKPIEDTSMSHRALDTVLHLSNKALATSGNYRQFYYKDGKRYSHTINPISGRPVDHQLLSATVIAPDCMTADAMATACMVMGAEKSLELAETMADIEIYLIVDVDGDYKSLSSSGMTPFFRP